MIEHVISPSSGEEAASPGRTRGSVMVAMSCDMAARSMAALARSLGCAPGESSRNSQSGARMSICASTAASSSWQSAASSTASAPPCIPSLASRPHRLTSKERTGLPKSDTSRRTPWATASASRAASRTEMRLTRTAMAPPLKSFEPDEKCEWRSSTAAASLRERKKTGARTAGALCCASTAAICCSKPSSSSPSSSRTSNKSGAMSTAREELGRE